jgi:hypothetical protein
MTRDEMVRECVTQLKIEVELVRLRRLAELTTATFAEAQQDLSQKLEKLHHVYPQT